MVDSSVGGTGCRVLGGVGRVEASEGHGSSEASFEDGV